MTEKMMRRTKYKVKQNKTDHLFFVLKYEDTCALFYAAGELPSLFFFLSFFLSSRWFSICSVGCWLPRPAFAISLAEEQEGEKQKKPSLIILILRSRKRAIQDDKEELAAAPVAAAAPMAAAAESFQSKNGNMSKSRRTQLIPVDVRT